MGIPSCPGYAAFNNSLAEVEGGCPGNDGLHCSDAVIIVPLQAGIWYNAANQDAPHSQRAVPLLAKALHCSYSAVLQALTLEGHGALRARIRFGLVLGREPEACRRRPQQHFTDVHLHPPTCKFSK